MNNEIKEQSDFAILMALIFVATVITLIFDLFIWRP